MYGHLSKKFPNRTMTAIKLFSALTNSTVLAFGVLMSPVAAQVIPDGTTSTTVDVDGTINDGNRAGGNLFHSFQEFSVPDGGRAFFNNALDIVNIFSRVTGGNISDINGLIRANGTANLFLLNPAGIIFGANARLSLGGSFFGSTADSIIFSDGEFSALDVNNPPLLTVNAPLGLGIRDNPAEIVNRSFVRNSAGEFVGLEVTSGNSLTLVGGNINFEAGEATASGGSIELGGLSTAGTVTFNDDGTLNFPENVPRADITLSNAADVDVRGTDGGSITINARNLNLEAGDFGGSRIIAGIAANSGFEGAEAGDININATGAINLSGASRIQNQVNVGATGNSGDINVTVQSLTLTEGSFFSTNTFGQGNAGDIEVKAQNLTLRDDSQIRSSTFGQGNPGNININVTDTVTLSNNADIISEVNLGAITEAGSRNNINITADSFSITDGASSITTATFGQGNAGNINLNIQGQAEIIDGNLFSNVASGAVGDAGTISIQANSLSLLEGGQIETSVRGRNTEQGLDAGQGNAGSVVIDVDGEVLISGSSEGSISAIFSNTGSETIGNAGNITITAGSLSIEDGAFLSSNTRGQGNGGQVMITANTLFLTEGGAIRTETSGQGNAGNIIVNTDDSVNISGVAPFPIFANRAVGGFSSGLLAGTEAGAEGQGGEIIVNTSKLTLSDGGVISARSRSDFAGGNITVNVDILEIRGGGQIQAAAFSKGSAGNINLNIKNQITIDGSDPTFQNRFNSLVDAIVDRGFDEETANTRASTAIDPVSAESGVFANTISGSQGDGGNITIGIFDTEGNLDTTQFIEEVNLSNQGTIAADSAGYGSGGTITIRAENINLDSGEISATTNTLQEGANPSLSAINLFVKDNLTLRNNSTISAEATNNADGGNIVSGASFIIGFPSTGLGNDIRANAGAGKGGNISIETQQIFGFEESRLTTGELNNINDLDASSETTGLDGVVTINTPDVNPLQGTNRLPINPIPADTITSDACSPRGGATSLIVKGKGGISTEPTAPFTADALIPDGKPITVDKENDLSSFLTKDKETDQEDSNYNYIPDEIKPFRTDNGYIYPARGVIIQEDGTVTLTTYPTDYQNNRVPKNSVNCHS